MRPKCVILPISTGHWQYCTTLPKDSVQAGTGVNSLVGTGFVTFSLILSLDHSHGVIIYSLGLGFK